MLGAAPPSLPGSKGTSSNGSARVSAAAARCEETVPGSVSAPAAGAGAEELRCHLGRLSPLIAETLQALEERSPGSDSRVDALAGAAIRFERACRRFLKPRSTLGKRGTRPEGRKRSGDSPGAASRFMYAAFLKHAGGKFGFGREGGEWRRLRQAVEAQEPKAVALWGELRTRAAGLGEVPQPQPAHGRPKKRRGKSAEQLWLKENQERVVDLARQRFGDDYDGKSAWTCQRKVAKQEFQRLGPDEKKTWEDKAKNLKAEVAEGNMIRWNFNQGGQVDDLVGFVEAEEMDEAKLAEAQESIRSLAGGGKRLPQVDTVRSPNVLVPRRKKRR